MCTVVTLDSFREAFKRCGLEKQFSYDGQGALFNHLQELEDETGEGIELDAIALCCDYTESTIDEAPDETGVDGMQDLRESTDVIEIPGTDRIIYQNF